jgi:A/G-specific adenine glycosylase
MKLQSSGKPVTVGGLQLFSCRLLAWYEVSKRDLPWRHDRDPYHVWLSEIMLQQTRVAAVVEYYRRFLTRFPSLGKLARARQASVLAAWSGLGYYRRARMLHAAAKAIVKEHAGEFPESAAQLRALPGIGRYTAAAIASIAFNEPVAVVDGNVERVLGRVSGERLCGQRLWHTADSWLDRQRPGDFNQAMMELGAMVCLPRQPKCLACPVIEQCATRGETRKPEKEIRQRREIHYALRCRNQSVLLVRRPESASLMPGMWELPEIAGGNHEHEPWLTLRHSITVTDYLVRVTRVSPPRGTGGKWVERARLPKLPLTGLARKILRAAEVI